MEIHKAKVEAIIATIKDGTELGMCWKCGKWNPVAKGYWPDEEDSRNNHRYFLCKCCYPTKDGLWYYPKENVLARAEVRKEEAIKKAKIGKSINVIEEDMPL